MPNQVPQEAISAIIAITIILMFLGVLFIVMLLYYSTKKRQTAKEKETMQNNFKQEILKTIIETQEETLSTLGEELHDNIGQLLNSTKLMIGVCQRQLTNIPDTLLIADQTLATAINELRALSKSLNKEWLQQFDFIENLETEIKRINAAKVLHIHFTHTASIPFNNEEQVVLFRIVQEAVQNTIKHASAKNIHIGIQEHKALLTVSITDDGMGFSSIGPTAPGVGLINMRHRTEALGGGIEWKSSENGTAIHIQLPIKPVAI